MSRLFKVSLIIFVVLLVAILIFSRRDHRSADGYLTVGFPLTFYSALQNMGCLGPLLPDDTCCVDLCPPELSFASLIVDVGLTYAASLVLASSYIFVGRSFSSRRNKRHY